MSLLLVGQFSDRHVRRRAHPKARFIAALLRTALRIWASPIVDKTKDRSLRSSAHTLSNFACAELADDVQVFARSASFELGA
uniref:hypothetical protein n=1 Tax=Bradyrhizobium sp. (strain ORS 278) TaxID=114615 RepID=UPI0012FEC8EE|nr:hypothetical protein [Bradyrhizobium sp. ORS 278]